MPQTRRHAETHLADVRMIAKRLGMQQAWRITDRLRLFNLAPEFMAMFEGGQLAAEAVYEISRLENHADQTRVIQAINRGQLSGYNAVRAAVKAIQDAANSPAGRDVQETIKGALNGDPTAKAKVKGFRDQFLKK